MDRARPRVMLAGPDPRARSALHDLVETRWRWQVVGEAADALEAVRLCRVVAPDVLIEDAAFADEGSRPLWRSLQEWGGTLLVSLIALPPHREGPGVLAALKGIPASHLRSAIEGALEQRAASS